MVLVSLTKHCNVLNHLPLQLNTLRPRQNGRHFADDIFKYIFLNENVWIPIEISLKFVPKGGINNIPVLVPIMAWRRPGDKPLSESIMVSLLTHICVTRPQWVNMKSKTLQKNLMFTRMWIYCVCLIFINLHFPHKLLINIKGYFTKHIFLKM